MIKRSVIQLIRETTLMMWLRVRRLDGILGILASRGERFRIFLWCLFEEFFQGFKDLLFNVGDRFRGVYDAIAVGPLLGLPEVVFADFLKSSRCVVRCGL